MLLEAGEPRRLGAGCGAAQGECVPLLLEAAAQSNRPLRLLSLLSIDASLANREQVDRIVFLRALPRAARAAR